MNWLFTNGCFVLTYLRASYVPEATTDRKPVAKVLLHVLRHKHCHHQTDIARLQVVHRDSQSIYRQSIHLQTITPFTDSHSIYRQSVQTVDTDESSNVPKLRHYLFPGIIDMAYLNA